MMSKETQEAVRVGILTNEQLDEAIKHYTVLVDHLKYHGDVYHLVYVHAYLELERLNIYKESRKNKS